MRKFKVKIVQQRTWEDVEVEAEDEESAITAAEEKIEEFEIAPDNEETVDNEVEAMVQTYKVTIFLKVKVKIEVEAETPEGALEQAGEDTSYSLGDAEFEDTMNVNSWEVEDANGQDVTPPSQVGQTSLRVLSWQF